MITAESMDKELSNLAIASLVAQSALFARPRAASNITKKINVSIT